MKSILSYGQAKLAAKKACILLSKLTRYKWRKETLKEVIN